MKIFVRASAGLVFPEIYPTVIRAWGTIMEILLRCSLKASTAFARRTVFNSNLGLSIASTHVLSLLKGEEK